MLPLHLYYLHQQKQEKVDDFFHLVPTNNQQFVGLKIHFWCFYLKNQKDFRDRILNEIDQNDHVLDIGMAMRDRHKKVKSKSLETLDVNDFGEYPDIILVIFV